MTLDGINRLFFSRSTMLIIVHNEDIIVYVEGRRPCNYRGNV
jgi:hypothetical protein